MSERTPGHVYWISGLSGAGKTTISRLFYDRLLKLNKQVLILDGDELRQVLQDTGHYSYEERKKLAFTYSHLCKMIADQGIDVIIATISMFHECHQWNRENIPFYHEIYLRVPMGVLEKRNENKPFFNCKSNVVGVDIPFEEPIGPHLILENYGDLTPEKAEECLYQYTLGKCK